MAERDGPAEPPQTGHETREVYTGVIGGVAAALVAAGVVIQISLWGLFVYYKRHVPDPGEARNPLAASRNAEPLNKQLDGIPSPRLEGLRRYPTEFPYLRS